VEETEKVQSRATKLVTGLQDIPYKYCLKIMNLLSLVYHRYRGDMIEVYNYLFGKDFVSSVNKGSAPGRFATQTSYL